MANRMPSKFKSICVLCGSDEGNDPSFMRAATELGCMLAAWGIDLVYGGGSLGLKGAVATAVAENCCHVLGVIPYALMTEAGDMIGKVQIVSNTHYQRVEIARQADAFITIPGDFGTLEELFGVVFEAHLGLHHKPIGLLNVDGYYDHLLSLVDKAVYEGLAPMDAPLVIVTGRMPRELLTKIEALAEMRDVTVLRLGIRNMNLPPNPSIFIDFKLRFAMQISEAETFEVLKDVSSHYFNCIRLHENNFKKNERKQLWVALAVTEELAPPEPESPKITLGPPMYQIRREKT